MTRDCEFCGSPAQLQFTEVVGGAKNTIPVCARCARERGIVTTETDALEAPTATPPALTIEVTTVDPRSVPTAPRRCPGCNISLVEIRKTGRVGCPACYTTFREHLEPLLQRVHGATRHVGADRASPDAREELRRLRAALGRAVAEEDYEAAARLRDRIESARARIEAEGEA